MLSCSCCIRTTYNSNGMVVIPTGERCCHTLQERANLGQHYKLLLIMDNCSILTRRTHQVLLSFEAGEAGISSTHLVGHELNIHCRELLDAEKVNILPQLSLLQRQVRFQVELTYCSFLGEHFRCYKSNHFLQISVSILSLDLVFSL